MVIKRTEVEWSEIKRPSEQLALVAALIVAGRPPVA